MTARRKPSFANLLRRAPEPPAEAAAAEVEPAEPAESDPPGEPPPFAVDPARVRLWPKLGRVALSRDACAAIARGGQEVPVTVRPVFDDEHFEYEAIDGAETFSAVRRLREIDSDVRLMVRVALVDDEGAAALAAGAPEQPELPEALQAAFAGEVPPEVGDALTEQLHGPFGPALLATAFQVGRAQEARRDDGLPPYPATEVLRLLDTIGEPEPRKLGLAIVDADARSVTFRLEATEDLTPETLARAVKAMVDGAANDGFAVEWGNDDAT